MNDNLRDKGILIVEDEVSICELLYLVLKEKGFSNVYTVHDGVEALSMLDQHPGEIHVILLDLGLPRMGGLDLMRHLVNVHMFIVGIVVLTGYASPENRATFQSLGTSTVIAANFISKPYTPAITDEIEKTIALVSKKRAAQANVLTNSLADKVQTLEHQIVGLSEKIDRITQRIPNFTAQLGLDVLRTLLIGILVIVSLYFGLGDILVKIVNQLK
ncbi:MAG: response regulator [Bacteroidetes bacterium]|nr:response regulator [Bacteroidota bacterium]MCW5894582.1 response regulator [Bacteroidota bacterium]